MDEHEFERIRARRAEHRAAERVDHSRIAPSGPTVAPFRDVAAGVQQQEDDETDCRTEREMERQRLAEENGEAEIDRLRQRRADRRAGVSYGRPDIDQLRADHIERTRTPAAERQTPFHAGESAATPGFRQSRIERAVTEAAAAERRRRESMAERDRRARRVDDPEAER